MQIVPFLTHYLLVYANFDFSSFSLISYLLIPFYLYTKPLLFTYVFPSIYPPIPFYLHTYFLLFTLGRCIIDILEELNYHRDETNLSSR